jgi:hypothetical protein
MKTFKLIILATFLMLLGCNPKSTDSSKAVSASAQNSENRIDSADLTNNFYDNEPTFALKMQPVMVEGEITNPGEVDFSKLPVHSVIVKETLLAGAENKFTGAYRYDGYSLLDILNERVLNKANTEEFKPIIDLYVVIEGQNGEKAIFSWGEIYYPNHLHEILIAKSVMRIVPSKTRDLWPLAENFKIIAGTDLITERNIENPVKITVKSVKRSFEVNRDINPMFLQSFDVFVDGKLTQTISIPPKGIPEITYETIFYGRGRGIHSTTPFKGTQLKQMFPDFQTRTKNNIRNGMLVIAALDGYRTVFTYSEVFNRNDQAEVLMIYGPRNQDGGAFTIFPAADFFSDRSVKSIKSIYFDTEK